MSVVGGISAPSLPQDVSTGSGPLTVATALTQLARNPSDRVDITDSVQEIVRNLAALQAFAARISSLSTNEASKTMTVTAAQFDANQAVLASWGARAGQTVALTAAKADISWMLPSYVTSVKVRDSTAAVQSHLDTLETAASDGRLHEVELTQGTRRFTLTVAQLAGHPNVWDKIKNAAYSLAVTDASVNDVLGPDGNSGLATNTKIQSIAITDTTQAIESHLDALQRLGLRIKTISQTDAQSPLSLTGQQYRDDALVLRKIITSDMLDVMDASAAQARILASDRRVVTFDVRDTASNLARRWSFLQQLGDSLTSVEVTDQQNAIRLTRQQFAASIDLLSKLEDDGQHSYNLTVSNVSAAEAASVAGADHVTSVEVADAGANLVANLDALGALNGQSKLSSVKVADAHTPMTIDAARFHDGAEAVTSGVLAKIRCGNYEVATTDASVSDVDRLASDDHFVRFTVLDSSDPIESGLDSLYRLRSRLTSIRQTDAGVALDLTQAQLRSRVSVLAKIIGGYLANVTT
jgi:hypothetical protein